MLKTAKLVFGKVEMIWAPLHDGSEGNIPRSLLDYAVHWDDNPHQVTFIEVHRWKTTGEIAKQSAHVMLKEGLPPIGAEQGQVS